MKKTVIAFITALMMTGCVVPSLYDDNESLLAVDVRMSVSQLDCTNPFIDSLNLKYSVDRLAMYSESKGSEDLQEMVQLMKKTADGLAEKKEMSLTYCELKKKLLTKQSKDIAEAVMGRY